VMSDATSMVFFFFISSCCNGGSACVSGETGKKTLLPLARMPFIFAGVYLLLLRGDVDTKKIMSEWAWLRAIPSFSKAGLCSGCCCCFSSSSGRPFISPNSCRVLLRWRNPLLFFIFFQLTCISGHLFNDELLLLLQNPF